MKFSNWLDWTDPGYELSVLPNNALDGKALISLSAYAGGLNFTHTMRPEQAKALAEHLWNLADQAEHKPEATTPWYAQGVTV